MAEPRDGRQRIAPLSPFEEEAGFTRALRVGDRIVVSGTVGVEADGSVAEAAGDQADRCFALIADHIAELGGRMADVVRVRMFVTDIAYADEVTASFSRALRHARPTGTLVAIAALYDPRWKVEIEAEAVLGSGQ
ncbi:enamine deaminase RidA (YjgF/YER057c/UK114 family) [Altererythrobacter atlanticus]|uniref:Endoribonuclease L-PSP n=1 Tax=Croceibacterium atlanticum TaxID=1267766 RepID=A0A0F7KYW3_9SPHN|nr:Rid family hydrolase [Croceibacterium atlanticum]AKH44010.1 Endoribonuclease L-PSP [Croceibacterium atlanticum]MBB5732316.1 enamine deaminase RidA (YjgF/YER057c/UK114 family) [Croceibacterium atlanticum]